MSRETRRLLIAGAAAIAALWLLARVRFDDQPPLGPVPAVLGQLSPAAQLDALAAEIGEVQERLLPVLLAVDVQHSTASASEARRRIVALRWRDDLALTLLPPEPSVEFRTGIEIRAFDPATHLAAVRVADDNRALAPLTSWTPRRAQQPRYLASTDVTPQGVSLRPAFVGALVPIDAVPWPGTVWAVPSGTTLAPGSFLFTTAGELVGLSVETRNGLAIVPGETVLAEAERLMTIEPRPAGTIAVDVQTLTEAIADVTGARTGVVVTSTERNGPASQALMVGDVIEAVDGQPLANRQEWDARMARLAAGQTLMLRVRRSGEVIDASVEARAVDVTVADGVLGLALRRRSRLGAEVTGVQPGSVAARAGLSVGDVITLFGDIHAPTPAQIARSFAALQTGERVMVVATRGESHYVTVCGP